MNINDEIKAIREAKLIAGKYGFIEAVKTNGKLEKWLLDGQKLQQAKAAKTQGKLSL